VGLKRAAPGLREMLGRNVVSLTLLAPGSINPNLANIQTAVHPWLFSEIKPAVSYPQARAI